VRFLGVQLSYFLSRHETRQNLVALGKFFAFVAAVVGVFTVLFHVIMAAWEGHDHSWLTGFYWTLTVMTTLGFGDITFKTDLGRAFSIVVLLTGNVLLLIVMPFAIIKWFYAPWLEAQVRLRAPRSLPEGTKGHVIICGWDAVARELAPKLGRFEIPHVVVEPDPEVAARMHADGIRVVTGDIDARATYDDLRVADARAVVTTLDDPTNTSVTLTVREVTQQVPVIALSEQPESAEILTLAGVSHVLALKQTLGEQLASRADTASFEQHVVGTFRGLRIVELPAKGTSFVGKTLRTCGIRAKTGVSVIGIWERGRLLPVAADTPIDERTVLVIVGTETQVGALRDLVVTDLADDATPADDTPILVVGGGLVGRSAAAALRRRNVRVHMVERDEKLAATCAEDADKVFTGSAADRNVLLDAGLERAQSIILTTNSDEMNVYLCIYCRKLRPDARIVSRITHERNLESIHRAGADFVLSYASLGKESIFSLLTGRALIVLGEGVELFSLPVPSALVGATLEESAIGRRTGLHVVAIERGAALLSGPGPAERLTAGDRLIAIGTAAQRQVLLQLSLERQEPLPKVA
jgi:Trk K+ transport system NAD-binding subunit